MSRIIKNSPLFGIKSSASNLGKLKSLVVNSSYKVLPLLERVKTGIMNILRII